MICVVGPQCLSAAVELQPEGQMEIPVNGCSDTDMAGFVMHDISGVQDAGAGTLPSFRMAA